MLVTLMYVVQHGVKGMWHESPEDNGEHICITCTQHFQKIILLPGISSNIWRC